MKIRKRWLKLKDPNRTRKSFPVAYVTGKLDELIPLKEAVGGHGCLVRRKRPDGGVGHCHFECIGEYALRLLDHLNVTHEEFEKNNPSAYKSALYRGWSSKIAKDLGWKQNASERWSFETCRAEALKYKYLADWSAGNDASYQAALNRGWHKRIKVELFRKPKPPLIKWSKCKCKERAKNFASVGDWRKNCNDFSYRAARSRHWVEDISKELFFR